VEAARRLALEDVDEEAAAAVRRDSVARGGYRQPAYNPAAYGGLVSGHAEEEKEEARFALLLFVC
jgi:hypothetical protein